MRWMMIFLGMAGPAYADISELVSVTDCELIERDAHWMRCNITNHADIAIESVNVSHLYTQEGRSVPWTDTRDNPLPWGTTRIDGGIEPGETINHIVHTPGLSMRADISLVRFQVTPIKAVMADGSTLE